MEIIISAIVGLITGALGSLLAPWVNWGIEKKKALRAKRENLINSIRSYLAKNDPKNEEFLNSLDYIQIRPFLTKEFIGELEDHDKVIIKILFRGYYQEQFFEQLDAIEEKWKLSLGRKNSIKQEFN